MDKGLFDPGTETEYLIIARHFYIDKTISVIRINQSENQDRCFLNTHCNSQLSYVLVYNDGTKHHRASPLCINHAKHIVINGTCPFSCIDKEIVHGMLYAVHWFNLSNRTMYKIGKFIKPLILFDSEGFLITEYDSRINPQTEVESIFKVLDVYNSVNNLARRAILTMWQMTGLHKDVRLLIAKQLWNENRIDWS